MRGPEIMARSMSALRIPDKFGNLWQYHSRSDAHSKIACWAIMFDLLQNCALLREQIRGDKVGFGLNHEMRDFQTRRKKDLDLVICTPGAARELPKTRSKKSRPVVETFCDMAKAFSVVLTAAETKTLAELPPLRVMPVGSVHVALEAKATMTEHIKALPRLHDELDSSHLTIHGHADHAIAAALITVNIATEFTSPGRNKENFGRKGPEVTRHDQPKATLRTIAKIHELRRRSAPGQAGFDAVGIVVVNFPNDGTDCTIVRAAPAPETDDPFHYDQMISRLAGLYQAKFAGL